jgi:hypothetical protein
MIELCLCDTAVTTARLTYRIGRCGSGMNDEVDPTIYAAVSDRSSAHKYATT